MLKILKAVRRVIFAPWELNPRHERQNKGLIKILFLQHYWLVVGFYFKDVG